MSSVVVLCDRWLGFGASYRVRVDGREVGRLGFRAKRVETELEAGVHSIIVAFGGNETPAQTVHVSGGEVIEFTLIFESVVTLVLGQMRTPWRQRIAKPVGSVPAGFMSLSRSN